jgi:YD repeat-containing protein
MKLSFLILILTCGCLPAAENFIPPPFYNGIAPPPLPTEPPATVHGKGKLGVITTQESATEPKKDERAVTPVVEGTRESLLGTRSLGIPLISVPGPARREGDLTELAEAVNAQAVDTVSTELRRLDPLKKWLSLNPNTEFSPSVALRIGQVSSQNGDFLGASIHFEALRSQFESSVNLSRAETQLLQKVLQEELSLYRRMGWKSQLEETLKVAEAQKNKTHLSYLISEARSALDLWQKNPLESMQCGLVAHNIVAAKIGLKVINRYDSLPEGDGQAAAWGIDVDGERNKEITTHGLSAELLLERIDKANAGWRWIRRVSGVSVPAPSVAHLRWQGQTGHYTAVLESSEDAARIEDIFLQYASWIDHEAFARQCSGFFLVPPNAAVPENFVPVGNAELAGVFGRNSCPNGKNPEDDDPCPKECGGMPVMTFSRTVPMLYIQDRPLPYRAQVGPTPDLLIQYRQRDFSGDSNILDDTSHFGPNWNHGLFSYIRAETGAAFPNAAPARWITAGSYLRYNRSGSTNTAPYVKPFPDRPALTALSSPAGFRLTFNDGTQMDFRQPNLPSNPTRYFLTTVRDAGNLAYTIHYINDGSNRIDYVVDASGTKTKFLYEGGDTKIKYIVTEYAEPVGPSVSQPTPVEVNAFLPEYRHASFTYNSGGLLASISDAAGLVSGFQYNDTKVVKMTTPYGDTKVSYQGTVEPSNSGWAITVTDPEGLVNRVESLYHDFYTPYFGGGAENPLREVHPPASISVRGTNVSFLTHHSSMAAHNDVTLEWTPKYWREYLKAKQQNPEIDPRLFAATTKWAMSYPSDQTVSVPLAYKEPGKAAVFYNYDGQTSGQHAGTSTQPSKTARQVEGRTATDGAKWVVSQQTYNSLGLPLVHTDELGRRTRVTYHTNNRDVHLEQYLGPNNTTWFTIRSYTGYSGGRPGTITEASGLQTVVTRNPQLQPTLINVKKGTSAAQNRRTRYTYNNGLVTQIHSVGSPDILLESMTYDNLGRLATHTDSRGYTRTFEFDNLDRILLVTHPDDSTESWTYERPEGFSLDATGYKDRSGRAHRTVYDRIRRPVAKIDPMGKITRYDWCSCGSLSKLIDPAGRTTTWVRDIQGRGHRENHA